MRIGGGVAWSFNKKNSSGLENVVDAGKGRGKNKNEWRLSRGQRGNARRMDRMGGGSWRERREVLPLCSTCGCWGGGKMREILDQVGPCIPSCLSPNREANVISVLHLVVDNA